MPDPVPVLDVAFSRIGPGWAHDRLAEGWRGLVQNVWTGGYEGNDRLREVAAANLRDWRQAGGWTAVYTNAAPWRTPRLWREESARNAGDELAHAAFVAIDYELADGDLLITDHAMAEYIALWAEWQLPTWQLPILVYSGDWFAGLMAAHLAWPGGRPPWYGLPYWYARYDGVASVGAPLAGVPRWPLGPVVAKQYGGATVGGVTVDTNVFDPSFVGAALAAAPAEEDHMLADDRATVRAVHALRDGQLVRATSTGDDTVYRVDRKGDMPRLVRIDDSRPELLSAPIADVPLGVVLYCWHGDQDT